MKRYIKFLMSAVVLLCSELTTVTADTENPEFFVEITKAKLTPDAYYYEFEYPDYDFDGNDDAFVNISLGINMGSDDTYVTLATMIRCHDYMKRVNLEYGAMEIIGTRNIDNHKTGYPEVAKDKGLRLVKVRYYPTYKALQTTFLNICVKGTWDIDDDGGRVIPVDTYQACNLDNRGVTVPAIKGDIKYDGEKYFVDGFGHETPAGLNDWTTKVILNNVQHGSNEGVYVDVNTSSTLNLPASLSFEREKTIYAWPYFERTISVRNGSYKETEGNKTITQKIVSQEPYNLVYKTSLDVLPNEVYARHRDINGRYSILVPSDNPCKFDVYRTSNGAAPKYNDYIGTGSIDNKWGSFIDTNTDPYDKTVSYYIYMRENSWTKRSMQDVLKHHIIRRDVPVIENGDGSEANPYLLNSPEDITAMRIMVNNGKAGKKFWKLNADIELGSFIYEENAAFEIGTEIHKFDGVFDGNAHTITMNVDENNRDTRALFGYTCDADIKNLKVTGNINVYNKFGAGFISRMQGGSISNCWSDVILNSYVSGDGTLGGFCGTTEQTAAQKCVFKNSVFTGKINGTNTNACGGLIGWSRDGKSTVELTNCLNMGSYNLNSSSCDAMVRNGATMQNCFYLNDLGDNSTGALKLNEALKGMGLLDKLGIGSYLYRNDVYPVLKLFSEPGADVVLDGTSVLNTAKDVANVQVDYNRTFYAGERCTVILPFDVDAVRADELGQFYGFKGIIDASKRVEFAIVKDGLKANTPYVMVPKQSLSNLSFNGITIKATSALPDASVAPTETKFVGSMKPVTVPTGAYGYSAGTDAYSRASFVRVGANVSLPAFCAYLWINGNAPKTMEAVFTDEEGEITGIGTLYQDEENPTIYSLDGRKLDKPERGINIINGKKVIVR